MIIIDFKVVKNQYVCIIYDCNNVQIIVSFSNFNHGTFQSLLLFFFRFLLLVLLEQCQYFNLAGMF